MDKISVKVLRDLANNPSIVEIMKNNRKITATFDPKYGLVLEGPGGLLPSVAEILQMAYPYEMPLISRPAWYDRNSTPKADTFDALRDPHSIVTRITYTVPANKVAMVELLEQRSQRDEVATTPGNVITRWIYTIYGEPEVNIMDTRHKGNAVGDTAEKQLGAALMLFTGDILEGKTADTSTAGKISYKMAYKLTEFDV